MKRIITVVILLSLLACVAFSAGAAELKKVVILNYPQEEALRQQMTAQAIRRLEEAGFINQQNVEIIISSREHYEEEMAFVEEVQPDAVIDFSYRILDDLKRFEGATFPVISAVGVEQHVNADGMPKANITGVYSTLEDLVFNSFKFLKKVAPLQPGQQAVFFENTQCNLITKEAVADALKRLNIPLKAVVNATLFEDFQTATLQYNADPEVGWMLIGVWPTQRRDGTVPDMATIVASWHREHLPKPQITYWENGVQWGILCGFGVDLPEVGKQTGEMAARVLKGEDINAIKAEYPRKVSVSLNRKTADTLGITFSPDVLNLANVIFHDWEGKEVTRKSGLK